MGIITHRERTRWISIQQILLQFHRKAMPPLFNQHSDTLLIIPHQVPPPPKTRPPHWDISRSPGMVYQPDKRQIFKFSTGWARQKDTYTEAANWHEREGTRTIFNFLARRRNPMEWPWLGKVPGQPADPGHLGAPGTSGRHVPLNSRPTRKVGDSTGKGHGGSGRNTRDFNCTCVNCVPYCVLSLCSNFSQSSHSVSSFTIHTSLPLA